jgi:hypothetical protein
MMGARSATKSSIHSWKYITKNINGRRIFYGSVQRQINDWTGLAMQMMGTTLSTRRKSVEQ